MDVSYYLSYFYYHVDDEKYKSPMALDRKEYVIYIIWAVGDGADLPAIYELLKSPFEMNSEFVVSDNPNLSQKIPYKQNWILLEDIDSDKTTLEDEARLISEYNRATSIIEYGPKYSMETPWSSNIKGIYDRLGINVLRAEKYTRQYQKIITGHKSNLTNSDIIESMPTSCDFDPITQQHEIFIKSLYHDICVVEKNADYLMDGYQIIDTEKLEEFNTEYNLSLDKDDIQWIRKLSTKLDRHFTKVEIYDIAQSNSEHSRHHVFNSNLVMKDGLDLNKTLFEMVKDPYLSICNSNRFNNSLVAFHDNASCILGENDIHPTLTAETHNFPTGIAPFEGSTTGVGGRIRDTLAIGKGGDIVAGLAGYCVEDFENPILKEYNSPLHSGREILTHASDGASDYGNKVGEPIIGGFCRTFTGRVFEGKNERLYSFRKPIMFSAGIGMVSTKNVEKENLIMQDDVNNLIVVQVGGPAYPIGMGGGSSSSTGQTKLDYSNAVQRGNPEMASRVIAFLRKLTKYNIILTIHDQGAGGCGNVVKEILDGLGGHINLAQIPRGDKSMSFLEVWCSEYQEQLTFIAHKGHWDTIITIAETEDVPINVIGMVERNSQSMINVIDTNLSIDEFAVSLPLDDVLRDGPQKTLFLESRHFENTECVENSYKITDGEIFLKHLSNILNLTSVGSKKFLTNKVDRSVSGLVVQQQCVGKFQLPLSNYAIVAHSYDATERFGTITAIGENSIAGFIPQEDGYKNLANKVVGEMLTNMMGAAINDIGEIRCSANWMWSPKNDTNEAYSMYQTMEELSKLCCQFGFAIDGGKDSVSMYSTTTRLDNGREEIMFSPPTLTLTGYAMTKEFNCRVTPDIKAVGSTLYFIPLIKNNNNTNNNTNNFGWGGLAGTQFSHILNLDGKIQNQNVRLDADYASKVFNIVQELIAFGIISSLHDISDGGLITTLLEMAFSGDVGLNITDTKLSEKYNNLCLSELWFCEGCGVVIEVEDVELSEFEIMIKDFENYLIATTKSDKKITLYSGEDIVFDIELEKLKYQWEYPSHYMEQYQTNIKTLLEEISSKYAHEAYSVSDDTLDYMEMSMYPPIKKYKVIILRDVGSNGAREMIGAFENAGFHVKDITMSEILLMGTDFNLDKVSGIVFVGGFSSGDVPSVGIGWASSILHNPHLKMEFDKFKDRENTFSLGVCNGCQVMSYLGFIDIDYKLRKNQSGRFESRWAMIGIPDTEYNRISPFFKNLIGAKWGMWVAHGEGRFIFPNEDNVETINSHISAQYINEIGETTGEYPANPNGSENSTSAVISSDGRHLAMMPHPERSYLEWQMPYCPLNNAEDIINGYTPWFAMFNSIYEWLDNSKIIIAK